MASSLHSLPEALELLKRDLTIVVDVHLVEELARRNFSESALPMLDCLVLVDGLAAINIEDAKNLIDLLLRSLREFLHESKARLGVPCDQLL